MAKYPNICGLPGSNLDGGRRGRRVFCLTLLLWLPLLLAGCPPQVEYVFRQGLGQFEVIQTSRPIDEVLAGDELSAEVRQKLELVVTAREFARQQLGLRVGGSYALYHETSGNPVAWNVSAARRAALVPRSWSFPIIGSIDYLGYFSEADALAAAERLQTEGYDTYVYPVDAYSTLGYFPDPVHSSFLNRSDGSLVETVIHELAHNTVYAAGQSTFNESLATFIGRRGARLFFEQRGAAGAAQIERLRKIYEDQALITQWMLGFEQRLREYYARDVPAEAKIAGRDELFAAARTEFVEQVKPRLNWPDGYPQYENLPVNNAFVLLYRRYNLDLDVFEAAYQAVAGEFAGFLEMLRAATEQADPFAALRAAAAAAETP